MKIHRICKNGNFEYHSNKEYIGSTSLKKYGDSPAHYKHNRDNPQEPTAAMIFGSVYHIMILTPEDWNNDVFCLDETKRPVPDKDYRVKENKEWKQAQFESNKGKLCISTEDYKTMKEMLAVLISHKEAWALLKDGVQEMSYYADIDNAMVKIRPDNYKKGKYIADLKSCEDASKSGFAMHVVNMGYHVSASMYVDVIRIAETMEGENIEDTPTLPFFLIAQEKSAPYAVAIYLLDDAAMDLGRHQYENYLAQHKKCLETGIYKGYEQYSDLPNNISTLSIPRYAFVELPIIE